MKNHRSFSLLVAVAALASIALYFLGAPPLTEQAAAAMPASAQASPALDRTGPSSVPFHEQYRALPAEILEHIQAF